MEDIVEPARGSGQLGILIPAHKGIARTGGFIPGFS